MFDGYQTLIYNDLSKVFTRPPGEPFYYDNVVITIPYQIKVDKNIIDTIKNLLILQ